MRNKLRDDDILQVVEVDGDTKSLWAEPVLLVTRSVCNSANIARQQVVMIVTSQLRRGGGR